MSVVSGVCCQVEVSATSWSLVQRTVVRRRVWSRNLVNEEALAHWGWEGGATAPKTKTVDGGEWLTSRSGRFAPGTEPRYQFNGTLGGPQIRCGRVWR